MGYEKKRINGSVDVCNCGQHYGKGTSSPYQLAQIYAWFKDFKPDDCDMNQEKWEYLKTYENRHGSIQEYIYGKNRISRIEYNF